MANFSDTINRPTMNLTPAEILGYKPGAPAAPVTPSMMPTNLGYQQPQTFAQQKTPPDNITQTGVQQINQLQHLFDTGQKAAKVVEAGLGEIPPTSPTETLQYFKQLSDTHIKNADEAMKAYDKLVDGMNQVLANPDYSTTPNLEAINKLIEDSKSIKLNVTSPTDFFWEKDDKGNYTKMTKQGSAVLIIAALSQLFGSPQAKAQNINLVQNLGKQFADVENQKNQAQYKNALDDYQRNIQANQTQAQLKVAQKQDLLRPLQQQATTAFNKYKTELGFSQSAVTKMAEMQTKLGADIAKADEATKKTTQTQMFKTMNDVNNTTDDQRYKAWVVLGTFPEYRNADGLPLLPMPYLSEAYRKQNGLGSGGAAPMSIQKGEQSLQLTNKKIEAATTAANNAQKIIDAKMELNRAQIKKLEKQTQFIGVKGGGGGGKGGNDPAYNAMIRNVYGSVRESISTQTKANAEIDKQIALLYGTRAIVKPEAQAPIDNQIQELKAKRDNNEKNIQTQTQWLFSRPGVKKAFGEIPNTTTNVDIQKQNRNAAALKETMKAAANAKKGK